MCVLSLDPSFRAFGYAVLKDNDFLDGGCIVTKPTSSDVEALQYITKELKSIIQKNNCTKVVFEKPVGSKSSRANQSLSYVLGLVVSLCVSLDIEFSFITARNVKKHLTSNLDATKDEILSKVKEKLKSFDKKTKHLPKFKLYAVSDAAAVFLSIV